MKKGLDQWSPSCPNCLRERPGVPNAGMPNVFNVQNAEQA